MMEPVTGMVRGPAAGLARLRDLAAAGGLDELCERLGIAVLTAFGSAVHGRDSPHDLDLAVLHEPGRRVDYLPLIEGLQRAAGVDVDVAVLDDAGPVLRERALVGAEPLYESEDGRWAGAATAAALERMDTAWMRRLDRDLLAG